MADDSKPMVMYTATYDSVSDALTGLDAINQLHRDQAIGAFDAAVIDKKDGQPHIAKRMDRPVFRAIPEAFGGGALPRKELKDAAAELKASEAGLIAVGEPTIDKALDKALTKADKVVKRTLDATTDEIASELRQALADSESASPATRCSGQRSPPAPARRLACTGLTVTAARLFGGGRCPGWRICPDPSGASSVDSVGVGERKFDAQDGSRAMRAVQEDLAAERLDPVPEAGQPGTGGEAGAPAAVITNRDTQGAGDSLEVDGRLPCACVLRCVRQRLRDDVVRRDLGGLGQPPVSLYVQVNRYRAAAGQHVQGRLQIVPGQDGGMDAARVLTQFVHRERQPSGDAVQFGAELTEFGWHCRLRRAQPQRQRDQSLLGAVVQIAPDLLAGPVGGGRDPRPRPHELGLCLGVGDRGRGEFGEIGDAGLGSGRERVAVPRHGGA
jgi:uncharacterized membrane protein